VDRGGREIKRRLKELAAALKAEPGSIPTRLELAAALREAGRPVDAIDLYRGVAAAYAEDGRLVQAMAVCKGILDIDPEHRDTLEMLATLAQRRKERDRGTATLSRVDGRWVAEPTLSRAGEDERTRMSEGSATGPQLGPVDAAPSEDDLRTPAEGDLRTPIGGDDNLTPAGDPELTPVPHDVDGPLNWRARSLQDEVTSEGEDPNSTRMGRRRRPSQPPPTDPGVLDFPDETKQRARGNRLLDLAPDDEELLGGDDEPSAPAPGELRIDTDRMPTLSDDEVAELAAQEATRRSTRQLESGRLPPLENELTFGDEDSAVRMLNEVIGGPFPRPALTVEPPPFPLLSDLPRGAFMELLARLSVVRLPAGQTVLREGEAGDACYLIAAGRVRVEKAGVEVAQLGPGSFFGEFAVLSDQRRHASVQSIDPVELLEIRRELLDELVAAHPGVARTLRTFYRERLLQTLLGTAPFFQRLSSEERAAIAERFRPRRFGRGAQIIEEGAPGGGLYLILVGEVEVVRAGKSKDGKDTLVRLGVLGEGSYFGEMSLLRGGVASATVRATRMTEAVQLPPRDFYELASQHPVLWEQLRSEAERRELANHAILAGEARKSDTFYLV
jgi:CRP-like cAMP-binding protein